ncbi:MAG: GNAT family protein [Bacteroidota bacterium]
MLAKAYKIETERLIIRCYDPKDAPLLKAAIDESIPHLRPWMPWAKHEPETVEAKADRLRKYRGQFDLGIDYVFGAFSKDEKVQIGSTGLHARVEDQAREIGYWINVNYIKQGYATEIVKALIKVGFEIEELYRIEIRCDTHNVASFSVPKKLGFTHEATLNNRLIFDDGEKRNVMIWSLFKENYLTSDLKNFPLKAYDYMGREILI